MKLTVRGFVIGVVACCGVLLSGCATKFAGAYTISTSTGSRLSAEVRAKVLQALEETCADYGITPSPSGPYGPRFSRDPKVRPRKGADLDGAKAMITVGFSTEVDVIGLGDPNNADETPFVKAFRTELEEKLVAIVGRENVQFKRDRVIALGP